ncbi:MAG: glycoside hydrolase family 3 C-terminal domain-containing protein [Clostridia bacterium]|nr:glycoside hydrolase family 3 C-terminal domain-containing protein [Clostridia bacterium]
MFKSDNPKYREARDTAAALVKTMTLGEKVIQLTQYMVTENTYNPEHVEEDGEMLAGRCGSLLGAAGAETVNKYQKIAVEYTPKNVPLLTGCDVIHGCCTTMPIPLALSCTFEPDVTRRCAAVAGKEARAQGVNWTFAPMVDIARDARWGRVAEGFGEDKYLCSKMAEASVRGFQDDAGILACMKHFVAYSACEGGRDYYGCEMSDQTLFNTFIPPFKAGIDAGAATVMSSFNDINGVPCSGSRRILTDVLREKLGFDGFVVSDYDSVLELINHGYADSEKDAVLKGYGAGVDVLMLGNLYNKYIPQLVEEGLISEEQINSSCERIIAAKYLIGLMDDPYTDTSNSGNSFMTEEYREIARNAAKRSFVLLENDGILPLRPEQFRGKKIGLTGPAADDRDSVLGCWAFMKDPSKTVSIKDALEEAYPDSEIVYAEGISFKKEYNDPDAALGAFADCDVIIAAMAEHASESGEATSKTSLELAKDQLDYLDRLFGLGKPVVLLVSAGRPLILTDLKDRAAAILYIWDPGTECGHAVCDVLTGKYNPAGRTTVSFPRSTGQCPVYYDHRSTGRPALGKRIFESKYRDCEIGGLYPFGYGKSYTSFEYANGAISKNAIAPDGELTVSCDVTNTGEIAGEDVVQLYVRDLVGSITRPVKELKGFEKIYLEPGQTCRVTFVIKGEDLAFWNADMEHVTEPGEFKAWIAHDSKDGSMEFCFTVS